MTRMQAEHRAARLNDDRTRKPGTTYQTARSLTGESEWCVVTYEDCKPVLRTYA